MFEFMLGMIAGGAVVWFAKAKLIAWYDAVVAKT